LTRCLVPLIRVTPSPEAAAPRDVLFDAVVRLVHPFHFRFIFLWSQLYCEGVCSC